MSVIEQIKSYVNQPKRLTITPDPDLNAGRGFDGDLILPILVDTMFSADIPETSDITLIPIEGRSNVTDHVSAKPLRIEVEAGFTAFDNFWEQTLAGNATGFLSGQVQGLLGPVAGKGSAFALAEKQKEILKSSTPWERYKKLKKLKDAVVLLTVTVIDQEYKSLVLTEISPKIEISNGDSVRFTAVFQQVSFVNFKTESVKLKKSSSAASKRKSATEGGLKPTTEASAEAAKKADKSVGKNLINKAKELIFGG